MNMVLSEVEEQISTLALDPQTQQEKISVSVYIGVRLDSISLITGWLIIELPHPSQLVKRQYEMLFVRGDGVVLVAPPART